MKCTITVLIDTECREWLKENVDSYSGFINSLISEQMQKSAVPTSIEKPGSQDAYEKWFKTKESELKQKQAEVAALKEKTFEEKRQAFNDLIDQGVDRVEAKKRIYGIVEENEHTCKAKPRK